MLSLGEVVLATVLEGYGVDTKMVMQMLLVQMGRNNDLKPVAPHLLCQHHAQCVTLLRRDLSGLEALIAVPCNVAVLLTIALLGQDHLLKGNILLAIDGSDELPCSGLVGILGVGKHIEKSCKPCFAVLSGFST